MRARLIEAAGLILAGTLAFSSAYGGADAAGASTAREGAAAGGTELQAGVSYDMSVNLAAYASSASAGVSGIVAGYLDAASAAAEAQVRGNEVGATAAGKAAGDAESAEDSGASGEPAVGDEGASEESGGASLYGYENLGVAQVDGNLNVRKGPSTDDEVVGKMPDKAGCEILGTEGEWTKIRSGKVEGYVKSEYLLSGDAALSRADEVKQTIATVTTTTLFVREEPNTECQIITMMPEGEELEVLEELDGWIKINVDSDEGYVSSDYVKISLELPKAMTITEIKYGQGVSDVRVSLVQFATQFVGNPYVWGGTSLTRGADCSGFVLSVFANYGISLPHSAAAQSGCGTAISASEARPGDLFFYSNGRGINHVAIYIGGGQVVHASSPKSGIKISGAYYRTPVKVVRLLNG